MSLPLQGLDAITLFAEDLPGTKAFYQDVLELRLVHEDESSAAFDLGNVIVNLLRVTDSPELIEPAVAAGPGAGPRFVLTTGVTDVDATCTELTARGAELLNGPVDRPWGIRAATFVDPAGNVWEIAQPLHEPSGH